LSQDGETALDTARRAKQANVVAFLEVYAQLKPGLKKVTNSSGSIDA
jgi:hypothetical protein